VFSRSNRAALVGLLTAAAAAASAALPAAASAAISPSLTLSGDTTAAKSPAGVGFDAKFAPTNGDSPKDVTISFPPGLLATHTSGCTTTAPAAACQVGSGTAKVSSTANPIPVAAYLVAPPSSVDIAGLAVVLGPASAPLATVTGAITLRTTPDVGLNIAFASPPNVGLSELNVTFTNVRLPSSCPATPASVTVTADSQATPATTAQAPLPVTGCSSLGYAPKLSATVTKDTKGGGATVLTTVTQAANEASAKSIKLVFPPSVRPSTADVACLTGTACTIGTASATSPLVPAGGALANGTVALGGSLAAPIITVAFPPPLAISITGSVNLAGNSVTFANVPDFPLASLVLTLNGGPGNAKAFTATCAPSRLIGKFTPQNGAATDSVRARIAYVNCARKPAGSGAASGFAAGRPRLRLKVASATRAPLVTSLSVGLPAGLRYNGKAVSTKRRCTGAGKRKKCATTITARGLALSGGTLSGAHITGGRLAITLRKPFTGATISLAGPLLAETKALQRSVKNGRVRSVAVTVYLIDVKHATIKLKLNLKV